MCDVCKSVGDDYLFRNGPKKALTNSNLYKVFRDSVAQVKLCYIHNIELFHLGEQRFLKNHLDFARTLAKRPAIKSDDANYPFGL